MADAKTHTPFTETAGIQCFAAAWPQPALPTPPPRLAFIILITQTGYAVPPQFLHDFMVPPRSRLGPAFGPAFGPSAVFT